MTRRRLSLRRSAGRGRGRRGMRSPPPSLQVRAAELEQSRVRAPHGWRRRGHQSVRGERVLLLYPFSGLPTPSHPPFLPAEVGWGLSPGQRAGRWGLSVGGAASVCVRFIADAESAPKGKKESGMQQCV